MARRLRSAAALGCTVLVIGSVSATAQEQTTCTYDPSTHAVLLTNGQVLSAVEGRITTESGMPCGEATVFNTDVIHVDMNDPGFLLNGLFAPGLTPEPEGVSEIEIWIQTEFELSVMDVFGTKRRDSFILGAGGLNVNGDDDADVVFQGEAIWSFRLRQGPDSFSAKGGNGTGLPFEGQLSVNGRSGKDEIALGRSSGSAGGSGGSDRVLGGNGRQRLFGGSGRDAVKGGPGNDALWGNGGIDKLVGGPGVDRCDDTKGRDVIRSCEVISD